LRFVLALGALGAVGAVTWACGGFGEASATDSTVDGSAPDSSSSGTSDGAGGPRDLALYVFGGESAKAITGARELAVTAHVAKINADGSLGAWTNIPALDISRTAAANVQHAGEAFLLGGLVVNAPSDTGQRVALGTTPGMGTAWSFLHPAPSARAYAAAASTATKIYLSGGRPAVTTFTDAIEGFDVAAGTWKSSVGKLSEQVAGHSMAVVGSTAYVIGGQHEALAGSETRSSASWRAEIQPDGSIAGFVNAGTLPSPTAFHASALVGKYLFTIGGTDSTGNLSVANVARGTIDATGSIAWTSLPPLSTLPKGQLGLAGACAVVVDRTIYVLGGRTDIKTPSFATVYAGSVDAEGGVSWKTLEPMPSVRSLAGCAAGPPSSAH
jgi:hypothetical protein